MTSLSSLNTFFSSLYRKTSIFKILFLIYCRWLGALLTVLFVMSVTIILLNILIAQLSLTYEQVQEDSLNCFTALRMQAVAIIEWRGRFRFWVGKTVTGIT